MSKNRVKKELTDHSVGSFYFKYVGWEMEKKLGDGMYDKMKEHDDLLIKHEDRLNLLEENDSRHEERLKRVEVQSIKLENTVMTENRETRETIKEQTENMNKQSDKLYDVVHTSINYKSDSQKLDFDLKKMKIEMWTNVFIKISGGVLALLSAGGAGYWLLTQLVGGGN